MINIIQICRTQKIFVLHSITKRKKRNFVILNHDIPRIWISPDKWDLITKKKPVYRGTSNSNSRTVMNISSPINRQPVNMPSDVQLKIDDIFESSFGIRFRERSLFSTGSLEVAKSYTGNYGEVRKIRPVEPFCFCWGLHSTDLYFEYMRASEHETICDMIHRLNFKIDDISRAIDLQCEIMLVGSNFQAIKID